jgi:hypothetical protein
MKKDNLKTCIACDDPIKQEGFSLLVCERCLREHESGRIDKQNIAYRSDETGSCAAEDTTISG